MQRSGPLIYDHEGNSGQVGMRLTRIWAEYEQIELMRVEHLPSQCACGKMFGELTNVYCFSAGEGIIVEYMIVSGHRLFGYLPTMICASLLTV